MSIESIPLITKGNAQSPGDAVPSEQLIVFKEKKVEVKENTPDLADVKEAAIDLQHKMKIFHNVDLDFAVHQASGRIMVTVTDKDTGKIIREIPPKEILNLTAKLEEMIGIIFDQEI